MLVPKLVRPGLDFVIAVQFKSRDRVKVVAQIKKDDIPFAYSTMDYIANGNLKALNIRIPQGGELTVVIRSWMNEVLNLQTCERIDIYREGILSNGKRMRRSCGCRMICLLTLFLSCYDVSA